MAIIIMIKSMNIDSREALWFLAQIAHQLNRYSDALSFLNQIIAIDTSLTSQEIQLFITCHRQRLSPLRDAWLKLVAIQKECEITKTGKAALIRELKSKIEGQITQICESTIALMDDQLLKCAQTELNRAYFHKLKGDFFRYLSQITFGMQRSLNIERSSAAYQIAKQLLSNYSECSTPETTAYLKIVLNHSILLAVNKNDRRAGVKIIEEMFENFENWFMGDQINEKWFKDYTQTLQILRDYHSQWKILIQDEDKGK